MTTHFELHKGQHPGWLSDEDRPAWLGDEDECDPKWKFGEEGSWYGDFVEARHVSTWPDVVAIRFKPDHWAIPALKAGYRPHIQGEQQPADYDGMVYLARNGTKYSRALAEDWTGNGLMSVIGYMPATPKPDTGKTYPPELVEIIRQYDDAEIRLGEAWQKVRALVDPPQVDPLVEVLNSVCVTDEWNAEDTAFVRAELAKHGLQIAEIAS